MGKYEVSGFEKGAKIDCKNDGVIRSGPEKKILHKISLKNKVVYQLSERDYLNFYGTE